MAACGRAFDDEAIDLAAALARQRHRQQYPQDGCGHVLDHHDQTAGAIDDVAQLVHAAEVLEDADRVFANQRLVRFTEMEYGIPREHVAEAAEAIGVPTMREFFGAELATRLREEGRRAAAQSAIFGSLPSERASAAPCSTARSSRSSRSPSRGRPAAARTRR